MVQSHCYYKISCTTVGTVRVQSFLSGGLKQMNLKLVKCGRLHHPDQKLSQVNPNHPEGPAKNVSSYSVTSRSMSFSLLQCGTVLNVRTVTVKCQSGLICTLAVKKVTALSNEKYEKRGTGKLRKAISRNPKQSTTSIIITFSIIIFL